MSRAIVSPTLGQAMQIAWDVGRCDACDGRGLVTGLLPDGVQRCHHDDAVVWLRTQLRVREWTLLEVRS